MILSTDLHNLWVFKNGKKGGKSLDPSRMVWVQDFCHTHLQVLRGYISEQLSHAMISLRNAPWPKKLNIPWLSGRVYLNVTTAIRATVSFHAFNPLPSLKPSFKKKKTKKREGKNGISPLALFLLVLAMDPRQASVTRSPTAKQSSEWPKDRHRRRGFDRGLLSGSLRWCKFCPVQLLLLLLLLLHRWSRMDDGADS